MKRFCHHLGVCREWPRCYPVMAKAFHPVIVTINMCINMHLYYCTTPQFIFIFHTSPTSTHLPGIINCYIQSLNSLNTGAKPPPPSKFESSTYFLNKLGLPSHSRTALCSRGSRRARATMARILGFCERRLRALRVIFAWLVAAALALA